ncbi:uncharacterized protein F5Z01DRAFT_674366 [Emericellopsis atlantica]|uniref:SWIRM domain-containing protein n=1 Tax=Emericellopsis atlantica TaxID=2614577 RepID=A0A9P7ZL05_9HYPO|nr:uncharacterized protein F5Z01DRAFT_674366 [Emericellopsis atlantica]KAG9254049.1 hypothetical protein F5Z01DRAFT_674366 [Emericellopsis atlantica]
MDPPTLMSPPDQVIDNFPQEGQNTMGPLFTPANVKSSSHPPPLLSPPHSPIHRTLDPPRSPRPDSMLPPSNALRGSQNFMYDLEHTHRQAIEQHRREHPLESDLSGPSDHDYLLTLSFRSKIMDRYRENPRNWLLKNLAQVRHDNSLIAQRYPNIMPARPTINNNMTTVPRAARAPRADRVTKPSAGPRVIRTAGGPTRSSPGPSKRSTSRASATPEPSRRTVAPNREDKDFESIPDLGPDPWETLSGGNALKVEWKGQPLDLSADPHAHLLHPAELALASNLRLDCATYLTSKRRIFERRLACIKQPKEFRKTDAQQACKIDVNKASKLWQAFDKVGWLQEHWMDKHLDKP